MTDVFNPMVLAGIALMLVVAKIGGELFERLKQPVVLGELFGGIVLGNLMLLGFYQIESIKSDGVIGALGQIGVILLLFEVGLETKLADMREVGCSAFLVAVMGVVAPFFLGWAVAAYFIPDESRLAHIFVGSVLCATSVGITARVLKDLGQLSTRESRIILGAAVFDDVMGLLILAVLVGAVRATNAGVALSAVNLGWFGAKIVAFLIAAFVMGKYAMPAVFRVAGRFASIGVLLSLSIAFCFWLSWMAAKVGLAPIIGAFAAGLVLEKVHFKPFKERGERDLLDHLSPVTSVLVPIFFVLIGMKVELRMFATVDILAFALALTVAAIIGKQICGLVAVGNGLNRLAIGLGMIPRGEVGLIIASMGATMILPNSSGTTEPVVRSSTFAAVAFVVLATTLFTPPALKLALTRKK